VGLPRSGHTQQRLVPEPIPNAFHEFGDGLRLIASGLVVGLQYKRFVFHSINLWRCGVTLAHEITIGHAISIQCRCPGEPV
jgi:hypothetical protein